MKKEKISIIVPVYNVEKYLEKCVDSIINQTYKNLEIILVDDGSPDSSGKICDELAKKDNRIIVYHKKNGGLSDARNYGVEKSTGEYIAFVDSDDYIDEDMYSKLYEVIKKENADIVECNIRRIYANNKKVEHYVGEPYYLILDTKKYLKEFLTMDRIYGSAWCKLLKRDVAKNIKFPYGKYYEDMYYMHDLFQSNKKVVIISDSYYNYFIREGSITTEKFSTKHLSYIEAANSINEYTLKNYPEYSDYSFIRQVYAYLSVFNQMIMTDNYREIEKFDYVYNYLMKNYKKVVINKKVPKNLKVALILIKINVNVYKIFYIQYKKRAKINK